MPSRSQRPARAGLYEISAALRAGCYAVVVRILPPHPALAPFVRDLMIVEVEDEVRRLRLPEPGLVLSVRFRGFATLGGGAAEARLPDVALTGMSTRAQPMRTSAGGGVILARFRPGGAARFFGEPLHALFGTTAPVSDLAPAAAVARTLDRVGTARDDAQRARAVEALLLSQQRDDPDPLVTAAVERLGADASRIADLAHDLGISIDALEKRFRRAVGCTPKQLASMTRLWSAIDRHRPGVPLAQLALAAGYYDQAHFSRALRAATGQAPGEFFRGRALR